MDDKEKVKKGGVFSDPKTFIEAASDVLPLERKEKLEKARVLAMDPEEGSSQPANRPLPSLSNNAGRRLFIGNIDPKITEFHLLKLFKPFGDVVQFDFLFHKGGPMKGEPRGYAFIAFETHESAEKARQTLDGKWAVSQRLAVKYASATRDPTKARATASTDDAQADSSSVPLKDLPEKAKMAQIKAIEAKLSAMGRVEEAFEINPEIKKYKESLKNERKKPYDRRRTSRR